MKNLLASILLLALALVWSCNSDKKESTEKTTNTDSAALVLSEFIHGAQQACVSSIELAGIANKSSNLMVRDFGAKLAQDSKLLLDSVTSIADSKGIPLYDSAAIVAASLVEKVSEKSGVDFERALIRAYGAEQRRMTSAFRKGRKTKDDAIMAFIRNNMPLLRTHSEQLQKIKEDLRSTDKEEKERDQKPA